MVRFFLLLCKIYTFIIINLFLLQKKKKLIMKYVYLHRPKSGICKKMQSSIILHIHHYHINDYHRLQNGILLCTIKINIQKTYSSVKLW